MRKVTEMLCVALLALPLAAFAAPEPQQKILANGLKVIVKEDHRAPGSSFPGVVQGRQYG